MFINLGNRGFDTDHVTMWSLDMGMTDRILRIYTLRDTIVVTDKDQRKLLLDLFNGKPVYDELSDKTVQIRVAKLAEPPGDSFLAEDQFPQAVLVKDDASAL